MRKFILLMHFVLFKFLSVRIFFFFFYSTITKPTKSCWLKQSRARSRNFQNMNEIAVELYSDIWIWELFHTNKHNAKRKKKTNKKLYIARIFWQFLFNPQFVCSLRHRYCYYATLFFYISSLSTVVSFEVASKWNLFPRLYTHNYNICCDKRFIAQPLSNVCEHNWFSANRPRQLLTI